MKKQIKKLALKTDKIVNLSKENAQGIVGGAASAVTARVLSVCWCRDQSATNKTNNNAEKSNRQSDLIKQATKQQKNVLP